MFVGEFVFVIKDVCQEFLKFCTGKLILFIYFIYFQFKMGKKIKNKSTQQQQQTLQNNNEIKKLERQKKLKIKKLLNKSKDYSSNEEIKFSEELLKEGYLIEYIETDGNCLFRSISDQLYNNQNKHYEIRNIIMNYILIFFITVNDVFQLILINLN